jgi:hypothetical protein
MQNKFLLKKIICAEAFIIKHKFFRGGLKE